MTCCLTTTNTPPNKKKEPPPRKKKEGLVDARRPFGPPHLNLPKPKPPQNKQKKTPFPPKKKEIAWTFLKVLPNLKNSRKHCKNRHFSKPPKQNWTKQMSAYFWENLVYFLEMLFQLVTFFLPMLCLVGHKIPQNISKSLFYCLLLFSKNIWFCVFLPNWFFLRKKHSFHHCSEKAIFGKVADNSQQTPKHNTNFCIQIAWNHS